MDNVDKSARKRHRAPYIARLMVSFLFGALLYRQGHDLLLVPVAFYIVYTFAWISIVELCYESLSRFPFGKLFRDFIDVSFITFLVVISGGPYSFMLLMYLGWVVGSSMYTGRIFGLFTAGMSMVQYGIALYLIHAGIFPAYNIFSDAPYELSARHSVFSCVAFGFTALTLHDFMYRIYSRLQDERNNARARNELIARDLEMAKKIQLQLIPKIRPGEGIAAVYRPMHQVGGDFYDIIRFRDPSLTGIFLCDVCGHGVSVAFITSMIKTLIHQSGKMKDNPDELLVYLNDMLISQVGELYITAIYCVMDRSSRTFTWANAGHHFPFLISGGAISELKMSRSVPLGVMTSDKLSEFGKPVLRTTTAVPTGSRILMFTDCLVETFCGNEGGRQFDDGDLFGAIAGLRDLPGELFVQRLVDMLVRFHGSEDIEDDLCIIAVDVY